MNAKSQEALDAVKKHSGNLTQAAISLGIARQTLQQRLTRAKADEQKEGKEPHPFAIEYEAPPAGTLSGAAWEIISLPDNTFRFGTFGDLHAASKWTRWDVREDLHRQCELFEAQAILDTGNWIDGEARFNKHELETSGMDSQLKLLARNYPKTEIPTYAVTGKDHEGWYCSREGVDVGMYCESIMQKAGHKWFNLGYMEADIILRNANSGATATIRVAHPGKGTSYALSYRPQKIIESYEGGEKPAVALYGHYHKLEAGNCRNVWYVQTGCQQDQTSFMRQIPTDAHVGGVLLKLTQDPASGSITGFLPDMKRYFNRKLYFQMGGANNRWSGHGPIQKIPRTANISA